VLLAAPRNWCDQTPRTEVLAPKDVHSQAVQKPFTAEGAENAETITSEVMEQSMLFLKKDPAAVKSNIIPFDVITKETISQYTAPEW
jgi:hypothetical protein